MSTDDKRELLWKEIVAAEQHVRNLRQDYKACCGGDLISVLKDKLRTPHTRVTALHLIASLTMDNQKLFVTELLLIVVYQKGETIYAWQILLSMDREWLIKNIEAAAEPIVQNDDECDFYGLLGFYAELSDELALRLARRGEASLNSEIRDESKGYLKKHGF
jgi:hypothetical protein